MRRQADITSYPVESGAEVSDHVQIKNNTFKLSGIITETPVRLEKDLLYSAGVNGTRISQVIQYLDKIFDSRQPITLVTEHKVYENVILSGISYDYKSEFAMQFDLEFEQIRLVSTATVNVIATKTQGNRSVGGTVKQKVVNNAPKKTESDTVTTEFKK
ncbi:TPA: phage baseplate protein [Klebsiella michiganensis]